MHAAKILLRADSSRLISDVGICEMAKLRVVPRLHSCPQYANNGFNPVAARLLVNDVQRFERLARKSWSARMTDECAASIIPVRLMSRFTPSMLLRPLSQPPPYTPLPPAPWSIVNLCLAPHRLCVISGWIMATARALCQSSSIGNWQAVTLLLCVWRRVRGVAGVRRLTGHDPSAPRPPGTQEHHASFLRGGCFDGAFQAGRADTDELWH